MAGPFFIAGTARCGTTQLRQVFGEHPDVYALKWETRFLVDPGGFPDLVYSLTTAYTPFHSDDALRRLAEILNMRLTGHSTGLFRGWGLADEIGPETYAMIVDRLWERLSWYELDVIAPPMSWRYGRWCYAPGEERSHRGVVARYFPERAELIAILREFTQELFGGAAQRAGKRTWCEKSPPTNLVAIPFLWELFPEATVITIMRHPLHVLASYLDQPWAPNDVDGVLCFLEPIYRRWLDVRPALLEDPRYVEVKAEELAEDWPARRRELFARVGLPDARTAATFSPESLQHREGQLSDDQVAQVGDRLGFVMKAVGYDAP